MLTASPFAKSPSPFHYAGAPTFLALHVLGQWLLRRACGWEQARISAALSMVHAIATAAMSFASMQRYAISPSEIGTASTEALLLDNDPRALFDLCADLSRAYMLHDGFGLVRGALGIGPAYPQWATALAHHLVVVSALTFAQTYGFARPVVLLTFIEESSTILLNLPQVLQLRHDAPSYVRIKAAFCAVFVVSRFSFMWAVVANFGRFYGDLARMEQWELYRIPFFALCGLLIGLRGLNLYWLGLIVRKVGAGARGGTRSRVE
jgi:hypothetical protein